MPHTPENLHQYTEDGSQDWFACPAPNNNHIVHCDYTQNTSHISFVITNSIASLCLLEANAKHADTECDNAAKLGIKRKQKGSGFLQDKVLFLARAWIGQSSKGCKQNERTLWEGIKAICRTQYKMNRSASSLRSTWQRVSREMQHYLAERRKVEALNISGINEDML